VRRALVVHVEGVHDRLDERGDAPVAAVNRVLEGCLAVDVNFYV
jgi:hypothetical protein